MQQDYRVYLAESPLDVALSRPIWPSSVSTKWPSSVPNAKSTAKPTEVDIHEPCKRKLEIQRSHIRQNVTKEYQNKLDDIARREEELNQKEKKYKSQETTIKALQNEIQLAKQEATEAEKKIRELQRKEAKLTALRLSDKAACQRIATKLEVALRLLECKICFQDTQTPLFCVHCPNFICLECMVECQKGKLQSSEFTGDVHWTQINKRHTLFPKRWTCEFCKQETKLVDQWGNEEKITSNKLEMFIDVLIVEDSDTKPRYPYEKRVKFNLRRIENQIANHVTLKTKERYAETKSGPKDQCPLCRIAPLPRVQMITHMELHNELLDWAEQQASKPESATQTSKPHIIIIED